MSSFLSVADYSSRILCTVRPFYTIPNKKLLKQRAFVSEKEEEETDASFQINALRSPTEQISKKKIK